MSTLKQNLDTATELWREFERCADVHRRIGIDSDTERAYRFYEGDQWYGLESGDEQMPVYNFIAPVVRYKTAMVAQNSISITYSAPGTDRNTHALCGRLSTLAISKWERLGMDTVCWDAVRAAMIAGDSYVYFYDGDGNCQLIDRTDIYFADESQSDISKQSYIFIKERLPVSEVRKKAKANGIPDSVTITVTADEESDDYGLDKCTGLLKMWLVGDDLHFTRFTKTVVYQPETVISGLGCYPVAALVYGTRRGLARGRGEVTPMIPNQIEVNRNLARRILNAKLTAYSRLVYASDRIANPDALTEVGTAIEVDGGGVSSIKDSVTYLTPSSMSPDAKTLSDELLSVSKELAGAGDAALGAIDPTQASGSAIIAVRDQAALPLNEQTARFRAFAEDIARIWYRLWLTYGTAGADRGELVMLEPQIRVDIANASPFSKYAREQALERLFAAGHITFNEYVSAIDDDSVAPKACLENIIKNRGGQPDVNNQDIR